MGKVKDWKKVYKGRIYAKVLTSKKIWYTIIAEGSLAVACNA